MINVEKNGCKFPFKFHVRKGDTVQVLCGKDRGKKGVVLEVLTHKYRAIVEGINMMKKHLKPSAANSNSGTMFFQEAGVHISNLMVVDNSTGETSKIGRKLNESGKLVRYFKKSGKIVENNV